MKNNESFVKVSGFLDSSTDIVGEIKFKNSFRIDGKFKGQIKSGNSLIVGESGEIEADINVNNISINGRLKGTIVAKERVEIFSNGSVMGKIVTPKLIIKEGAFFQGSCQMNLKAIESGLKKMEKEQTEEKDKPIEIKEDQKVPDKTK